MASILKKEMGFQQMVAKPHTAGWHDDWTLGSSTYTIPIPYSTHTCLGLLNRGETIERT
ncbi:hypothetical protein F4678DRAFT_417698 [Xylaria arbuscula]|nr:hypothetical protein F4678DRAFT_417698 [Xylaria arbuscula]